MTAIARTLLPPGTTALEHALEAGGARLDALSVPLRELWSPAACPAPLLPWLAWAFSVDAWDDAWSEPQKRAAIAASYAVHRAKGTVAAVRQALRAADASARLVEWWQEQPPAAPHTFRVQVELKERGITEEALNGIERQVAAAKPVRSHFTLTLVARTEALVRYGIAAFSGETTEVLPYAVTQLQAPRAAQRYGIALQSWDTTTVHPRGPRA
ncbi:phage tail protein I [Melaminivora sp.]|uniref:phage tail protein I n=1 Tax=Melaminivora sp. TaxID=1933032 RepID=UPI0028A69861|nr:phage tail protein I [Melaminivora sp.]